METYILNIFKVEVASSNLVSRSTQIKDLGEKLKSFFFKLCFFCDCVVRDLSPETANNPTHKS